ncbi:PH domain-containing protein [Corynebacterium sp. AOP40-9SA-29]|uniref:PH domain-containing protein n=1 Tax=Corynebacterium sp. AOP40-9SA-29 TaxID=3457677 RepID=UPI0040341140
MSTQAGVEEPAGDPAGAQDRWRRVHPLSPLLRMWAVLVGIAAVLLAQQAETLGRLRDLLADTSLPTALVVLVAVVAVPVVFFIGWVVSLPWWRATGYRITEEEIAVRRGVLSRQLRTARFDRVQAVDVVEPLAPRLFRLAGVRVETAGGSDSSVNVEYLPRADAETLRADLLHLVNGTPDGADESPERHDGPIPATASAAGPAGAGEDAARIVVPTIPIFRSVVAAALSGSSLLVVIGVVVSIATPAGAAVLLPALAGAVPWFWGVLNASWRFTAKLDGDILGITFGLSERRRQSIPLDRVHAVEVSQPLVWRLLGWWKVRVDVAGYGNGEGSKGSTTTVLPVGELPVALHVLELLSPLSPPEITGVAHPQGRADELDGAQDAASGTGLRTYLSPPAARWVSPVDRTRQSVTLVTDPSSDPSLHGEAQLRAVVSHRGRLRRVVSVISPAHIQELTLRSGPVQKVLGLAGVRFDLVPGPVMMAGRDLTVVDATDLVSRLRARSLPAPERPRSARGAPQA